MVYEASVHVTHLLNAPNSFLYLTPDCCMTLLSCPLVLQERKVSRIGEERKGRRRETEEHETHIWVEGHSPFGIDMC